MAVRSIRLKPREARALISGALIGAGASARNARYLTDAILDTELSGLEGHGFYWLQFYCAHLRGGKIDGKASPAVEFLSPVSLRVDAKRGFAHPAIEKGFKKLIPAAKRYGIAAMSVHNSYNAATLGFHTGYLARHGLLSFGFTNSTPAIAPFGGKKPVIGTNPMSFAVPGKKGSIGLLIDQSASAVAWTAVNRAAEEGRAIPLGWAIDQMGRATTDPNAGLAGSMAPAGGYKGFNMGLIVEIMCAAVAGANRGPQMGSFIENDGRDIGCGQFFIAIEPRRFAGDRFQTQLKALRASILKQKGARLPNARREANIKRNARLGLAIERSLHDRLRAFARGEWPKT